MVVDLVGEDALHHKREVFVQLYHMSVSYFTHRDCLGVQYAYLSLSIRALIITVWRSPERSAWGAITASADATSLRKVLFSLLLSNLNLLFFAAPTELIRLEGALGFEVGAAMLGDVALRHICRKLMVDAKSSSWQAFERD